MTRAALLVGLCTAAMVLLAGALSVHGASRSGGRAAQTSASTAPADVVSLADLKRTLTEHKGHVVALHFWASWCYPCLQELPVMGRFARDMRDRNVDVLSFSLDRPSAESAAKVSRLIQQKAENALTKKILRMDDADALIAAIDATWEGSIPALFLFDESGVRRKSIVGETSREELDQVVAGLQHPSADDRRAPAAL